MKAELDLVPGGFGVCFQRPTDNRALRFKYSQWCYSNPSLVDTLVSLKSSSIVITGHKQYSAVVPEPR